MVNPGISIAITERIIMKERSLKNSSRYCTKAERTKFMIIVAVILASDIRLAVFYILLLSPLEPLNEI